MLPLVANVLLAATIAPSFWTNTAAAATLPMSTEDGAWRIQQILLEPAHPYRPTANSKHTHKYLDASANTVGILFMNSADEGVHVWLPIGERVFVSSSAVLPAQPLTARITSMVGACPANARLDVLDRIRCRVFPRTSGDYPTDQDFAVEFSRADELVRLAAKDGLLGGLNEWEVESYECV